MKYLLLFAICIAFNPFARAQAVDSRDTINPRAIAYYDAKFIYEKCFDRGEESFTERAQVFAILKKYYPAPITEAILQSNPFFGGYVPVAMKKSVSDAKAVSWISSVGGLDVTNIANGVAQLMIDRAKQELTASFFERFRKFVRDNREVQRLFPKTTDNLGNMLSYQYAEMLPTLRTGFFEDLRSLPRHLDDILELERYRELLKTLPEVRVVIHSLRLVHEIESGYSNPAEVLSKFAALREWKDTAASLTNMGASIKVAALFSESLRNDPDVSGDTDRSWITLREIKGLVQNDVMFRIYLGLVYQTAVDSNITFSIPAIGSPATTGFATLMEREKDNIFLFRNLVGKFAELAVKADNIREDLAYKKSQHITFSDDDYYGYINTAIDVVEYAYSIARVFHPALETRDYTRLARKSNDLYRHVYKEEYSQAVINAIDILGGVLDMINAPGRLADAEKKISELAKARSVSVPSLSRMDEAALQRILDLQSSSDNTAAEVSGIRVIEGQYYAARFRRKLDDLRRYGLVMANVVAAKTPEDVEKALDNAILPVGSSSIKKNTRFNIAVQSYLGGYFRLNEARKDVAGNNLNIAWNDAFGVTAPIGLSCSIGLQKGGSLSLFTSLFDLGAIVDYRLKQDSVSSPAGTATGVVEKEYKVELGQIFSPGLYLVYGLPWNIPISVGVGSQYGPGLSRIMDGAAVINNPYWRWNAFLAVDLPFFNLFTVRGR